MTKDKEKNTIITAISKLINMIKSEINTAAGKVNLLISILMLLGIICITMGSTVRYIGKLVSDTIKSIVLRSDISSTNPDAKPLELILVFSVVLIICMIFVYFADIKNKKSTH